MTKSVILTDEQGNDLGEAGALAAHTGKGQLHLAFSVYIFRKNGTELLIQRRSNKKMLWPMIWANTCCSHPQRNESAAEAGMRRLGEEMGFTCPLREDSSFVYRAEDPGGRGVEHEYVTILIGNGGDIEPKSNPEEVAEWKWITVEELFREFERHPNDFAPWLQKGLKILRERQ
jgi:isopentenyl-diphosphate delta-isomerase